MILILSYLAEKYYTRGRSAIRLSHYRPHYVTISYSSFDNLKHNVMLFNFDYRCNLWKICYCHRKRFSLTCPKVWRESSSIDPAVIFMRRFDRIIIGMMFLAFLYGMRCHSSTQVFKATFSSCRYKCLNVPVHFYDKKRTRGRNRCSCCSLIKRKKKIYTCNMSCSPTKQNTKIWTVRDKMEMMYCIIFFMCWWPQFCKIFHKIIILEINLHRDDM